MKKGCLSRPTPAFERWNLRREEQALKTVSGKRFTKVLRDHGWVLARISKHHIYNSPDGKVTVSVPVHNNDDLKTGILAALLKQTGLTEADL